MRYRRLGRTDLQVSELGMGGLFVGSGGLESGVELIGRAVELGIDFFDTAPSYRLGAEQPASQEILGRALKGVRKRCYIATKVGPSPIHERPRYDRDGIMEQVERSLKQLGRDTIDILHIHDPDRYGDPDAPGSYHAVLGRGMALETLEELKRQGVIGAIGLASLWLDYQAHCVASGRIDVVLTFNRYGLVWRDALFQLFPFCRRHDVGVVQGTPFHQGVLAVPHPEWVTAPPEWMTPEEHDRYRKLLEIQSDSGLPLPELALRFLLSQPAIGAVIQGAANVEQLEENCRYAARGPLPEEAQSRIEALGILHEDPRRYI